MEKINSPIRCSRELKEIIDFVRAKYILAGKKPPRISKITKLIANKIKKEDLIEDELIRL